MHNIAFQQNKISAYVTIRRGINASLKEVMKARKRVDENGMLG